METSDLIRRVAEAAPRHSQQLLGLRERLLADAVICGEIPAPTFREENRLRFLSDRFTENGVENSSDELGNVVGTIPGRAGDRDRNILVVAHADSIWEAGVDHTVTAEEATLSGPGLADNSLGISALASLPLILEKLKVQLDANLILLGATRSIGQGNLEGLRFFLDNSKLPIRGGICVEGVSLGRLSYSCLGMARAEIRIDVPEDSAGAIPKLSGVLARILAIERPEQPKTQILLGSVQGGTRFNVPPETAWLRFEVSSEDAATVDRVLAEIEAMIDEINAWGDKTAASLTVIARRQPGDLGFGHDLVQASREILIALDIQTKVVPSMSELSALLDKNIPGVTIGLTRSTHTHTLEETVEIQPLFLGLAHLAGMIQVLDHLSNEQ